MAPRRPARVTDRESASERRAVLLRDEGERRFHPGASERQQSRAMG